MEPSLAGGRRGYQPKQKQQKQLKHQHKDDAAIMYTTHRYNNSSSSPPFPHFPPPPPSDYPPPQKYGGCKMHRYPDDLDNIELCLEPEQLSSSKTKSCKGGNVGGGGKHCNIEPQLTWSRNNISATMERFEPASTPKIPPQQNNRHQHDYSYTYFDSGLRHQKMPTTDNNMAGPSQPPPPNSMRALLSTTNRSAGLVAPTSLRHMYTTRYGTQENIYEEIGSDHRIRMINGGQSMVSLNQSIIEEEFRRVQNRHRRVLGELNLSVEAMLMPSTPPSDSPTEEETSQNNSDHLSELLASVEPTDELLSPVSANAVGVGDMDSGFSGSSSGASYVGSLRYRTGSAMSAFPTRSSTPSGPSNSSIYSGSIRSSQRSHEDPGLISLSSRSCSSYDSAKVKSAEDPGPTVSEGKPKTSFWSRKGWRKLPGFSSTTSVHKAGIINGLELKIKQPLPT